MEKYQRNGKTLLAVAEQHIGEKYVFGARVRMNNPNHRGPWDCAEFVSWVVYQVGGFVFGAEPVNAETADAYTGFWYNHAKANQALCDVNKAVNTPGAILLRRPSSAMRGHIAFSDGKGGTVEAHSTKRGVCRARALEGRRWHFGVLLPGFVYDE